MRSHVRMFTRYRGSFGLLVLIHAIRSKLDNYLNLQTDWFMWYLDDLGCAYPATGDIHHAAATEGGSMGELSPGGSAVQTCRVHQEIWPVSPAVRSGIGSQCMVWNGSCGRSGLQQGPCAGSWRQLVNGFYWWCFLVVLHAINFVVVHHGYKLSVTTEATMDHALNHGATNVDQWLSCSEHNDKCCGRWKLCLVNSFWCG